MRAAGRSRASVVRYREVTRAGGETPLAQDASSRHSAWTAVSLPQRYSCVGRLGKEWVRRANGERGAYHGRKNGPYHVQGRVVLVDHEGNEIPYEGEEIWLCRCGGSATKPFCDGTHRRIGFKGDLGVEVRRRPAEGSAPAAGASESGAAGHAAGMATTCRCDLLRKYRRRRSCASR